MSDAMTYARELAVRLRWRHLPEEEVAHEVAAVVAEARHAGTAEVDLFGSAESHASTFARGRSLHLGYLLTTVGVFAAVAVVGGLSLLSLTGRVSFSLWFVSALVGAGIAWSFAMVTVGWAVDKRLPCSVKELALEAPRPGRPS